MDWRRSQRVAGLQRLVDDEGNLIERVLELEVPEEVLARDLGCLMAALTFLCEARGKAKS